MQNFAKKQNCLNLGTKMLYLGIFEQKCLICLYLGQKFKNTIVIFEISTVKFVWLLNLKCLIWIFLDWNLETILPYLKSAPSNFSFAKFTKKQKSLNLRPKIPYLDIFDKKCLIWVFLGKKCCKKTIAIFEISTLKFV